MRLNVCARSGLLFVLATRRERINIAQQRYNRHNGMMIAGVCLCLVVCVYHIHKALESDNSTELHTAHRTPQFSLYALFEFNFNENIK